MDSLKWGSQRGASFIQLLVVMTIVAITTLFGMPAFRTMLWRHDRDVATSVVQLQVTQARMLALKSKLSRRIVFHDETAAQPNRVEPQQDQSGTWITPPPGVQQLPAGVKILGSGSTNSMDTLVISTRGECTAGSVFVQGRDGSTKRVTIRSTCQTSI